MREALEDLVADGVPLTRLDLSGEFLVGAHLRGAYFYESILDSAILAQADLRDGKLLASMNFAQFDGADLRGAEIGGALFCARFVAADLRGARISDRTPDIAEFHGANVAGVASFTPEDIIRQRAVSIPDDQEWKDFQKHWPVIDRQRYPHLGDTAIMQSLRAKRNRCARIDPRFGVRRSASPYFP